MAVTVTQRQTQGPVKRELLEEFLRRFGSAGAGPFDSLEDLVVSPDGFGLTTATPLQRAVCRVIDGQPLRDLAEHPHVIESIGDVSHLETIRPRKVVWLAGVRTAKSLIAAALIVWAALRVDVRHIRKTERPRHSTVSIEKDLAKAILMHLTGALESGRLLRPLLAGEPTAEGCNILMPSGHVMEARIVAAKRAGAAVVARWSTGFTADEAPRMAGASDSVINLEDTETSVEGRLLPGAQIVYIGSPWAPYGPIYDLVTRQKGESGVDGCRVGRQTEDLVVIRARGDYLNPLWWTPQRVARLRAKNPTAYQTDVLANFADAEESLFGQALLEMAVRPGGDIPPHPGHDYAAAMDPATRSNAWTLVVADKVRQGDVSVKRVVATRQWQGSPTEPLRPSRVLAEVAGVLGPYGLDWCYTDQWSADALVDIGESVGLDILIEDWTSAGKTVAFLGAAQAMAEGQLQIPDDSQFLKDLRMVQKRVTRTGVSIELPHTPDGRHCDYAPAFVRAVTRWIEDDQEVPPEEGTTVREDWEAQRRHKEAAQEMDQSAQRPWWDKDPVW